MTPFAINSVSGFSFSLGGGFTGHNSDHRDARAYPITRNQKEPVASIVRAYLGIRIESLFAISANAVSNDDYGHKSGFGALCPVDHRDVHQCQRCNSRLA